MDAPGDPVQGLQKAAVCSICLEFFQDPVSIECGHNFCRACIAQCCEESRRRFCCPHCRRRACKRDFRPNRELASMVELAKRFKSQEEVRRTTRGKGECEKHQEPLKLFCEDDQILICVVCDRSKEHRSHTVTPLEEAALDYKEQIQSQAQSLKQEKKRLQDLKEASERTVEEYLTYLLKQRVLLSHQSSEERTETAISERDLHVMNCFRKEEGTLDAERKKMTSEFELLHQFLEEMEQLLLDQLDEMEMEVRKEQKESDIRFSEGISVLGDLINEMEENCRQSASEFLQNVKKMLSSSKKEELHLPVEISQDLKEKLSIFDKKNISLEKILKKFKDSLTFELQEKGEAASVTVGVQTDQKCLYLQKNDILPNCVSALNPIPPVENLTLDLDTAGPYLILSDDGKSMKLGDTRQKRATSRDQFNVYPCVLGSKGFSSGKHCWEVQVVEGGCWAVGVARDSVKRKKKLNFRPEEGIWALEHLGFDHYRALTSPPTPLPLSKTHQKVQVCLDYEAGQVAFFDAEKDTWIFTFPSVSFGGEIVFPWLWVGRRSQLRLCP